MNWKRAVLSTALGSALVLGTAAAALAVPRGNDCGDRIRRQEVRLERDIRRHGYNSHQAQNRRREIRRLRERCGYGFRDSGRHDRRDRRDRDHDRDDRNRWRH